MKKIAYILAMAAFLAPAAAIGFDDELMFPTDSRIRLLPYDESDVYTITTKYGYQTNLVFSVHEEIYTISIGDRSLWQVIPSGHRLFIRPLHEDVMTNMTVLTNKRSYHFDLKSVDAQSKNTSIMYVAKFMYPEDAPTSPAKEVVLSPYDSHMPDRLPEPPMQNPALSADSESTQMSVMPNYPRGTTYASPIPVTHAPAPAMAQANYSYTYSGSDDLAPLKVYDNGKSTFFQYRTGKQPLPNAYIVSQDGSEKPVAHYVRNGLMVVDDTAGEWLLKSSAGNVMVYNEMLNPN